MKELLFRDEEFCYTFPYSATGVDQAIQNRYHRTNKLHKIIINQQHWNES